MLTLTFIRTCYSGSKQVATRLHLALAERGAHIAQVRPPRTRSVSAHPEAGGCEQAEVPIRSLSDIERTGQHLRRPPTDRSAGSRSDIGLVSAVDVRGLRALDDPGWFTWRKCQS